MKVVVIALILGAGLAAVAEVVAPRLVEARVEQRVAEHTGELVRVDADAGSFPFLPTMLLEGRVERLAVTLSELDGVELPLARVSLELEDILLDRERLLAGEAEVTDIARGTVTAVLDASAVGDVAGEAISVGDGVASIAGTQLPLPTEMLPCAPEVGSSEEGPTLTCTFEDVPGVLVRAAGS